MTRTTKHFLLSAAMLLLLLPAGSVGIRAWTIAHPEPEDLPIPPGLIARGSSEGTALPATKDAAADLDALTAALQSQETRTGCGPASAATVLSALRGRRVSQQDVFTAGATASRPRWQTFFAGMPLDALAAMLRAGGAEAAAVHAGDSTVEAFREALRRNGSTAGDFLVVNYLRTGLGQDGGGHFSPVGAYDAASDRALILDVATLRYPPVWARVPDLFAAMDTVDPESGTTRGWIEVK